MRVVSFNPADCGGYRAETVVKLLTVEETRYPRIVRMFLGLWRLHFYARHFQADILHSHSAGGYAWAGALLFGAPLIVTPWGTDILVDVKKSTINKLLTMIALRRAAAVTTDGEHFVAPLKLLGVDRDKILLHQFGTDINLFAPASSQRRGSSGDSDQIRIISTRTPNPVHRVDLIIDAVKLVREKGESIELVVVGGGASLDALREKARQLGVAEIVRFTGMVNEVQLAECLQQAELYVSTSSMDAGLAASTAEAMSVGLPVIHSDNSDNSMWVSEGDGGYLFTTDDYLSLAEKICLAIREKSRWAEFGIRNRQKVERDYNRDIEMSKVEALYNRIR